MIKTLAAPACLFATALAFQPTASLAKAKTDTAIIYVAPTGNDAGTGSIAHPFKTLPRAQAAVRAANAAKNVRVIVADGVYSLDAPLKFTAADGGQGMHTVTWEAAPKARPQLSGGVEITGFTLLDAEKHVYVADVPKGMESRQLWVDGVLAERPKVEIDGRDIEFSATGFTIKDPEMAYVAEIKNPSHLELEMTGFSLIAMHRSKASAA